MESDSHSEVVVVAVEGFSKPRTLNPETLNL